MKKRAKIKRNAQAALEFLMTYGWIITTVLVAIGSLAYFGVLSPDKFLPRKCILEVGIGCMDFKVQEDSVTLVLRNGKGEDITISQIAVKDCLGTNYGFLKNGEQATYKVGGCANNPNAKFSGDVNITYTSDSGFVHKKSGRVTDRVESGCGLCACANTDTSCGTYPACNNCNSQDSYSANYCSANNVYRDFNDYSCASQACSPTTTPQLVQNCVASNGICQSAQCACANTVSSCGTFPSCNACAGNQICQNNQCVTQTCSDGTLINSCSATKPLYCNSGLQLVNSCSSCGCPAGKVCQGDGSCVNPTAQVSGSYSITSIQDEGDGFKIYYYDLTLSETAGITVNIQSSYTQCFNMWGCFPRTTSFSSISGGTSQTRSGGFETQVGDVVTNTYTWNDIYGHSGTVNIPMQAS